MARATPYHELDSVSDAAIVRKTKGRGCLVGAIILAIAVIAVVVIAIAVPLGVINEKYLSSSTTSPTTTCLTPECIKLAASVLAAIDQTVDPCTDFYKFSCGNWVQNTIIPTGEFTCKSFTQ